MRRVFYTVEIDIPNSDEKIRGIMESLSYRAWLFIDDSRTIEEMYKSAIEKEYCVTYCGSYTLPSWAFERALDCVVARCRKDFTVKNNFDVQWEIHHCIVVRS